MNGQIKGSPNIVADADSGRVWERIWEWMFVLCVFSMNDNNKINMKKKKAGDSQHNPISLWMQAKQHPHRNILL